MMAVNVTFEPGARTAWHNHHAGQYLIVTSGVGWVQERGGKKRVVRPGDVVWTPPGVVHWHGATTTNALSHLAVWQFVDGSGGELFEHVTDEDYLADRGRRTDLRAGCDDRRRRIQHGPSRNRLQSDSGS